MRKKAGSKNAPKHFAAAKSGDLFTLVDWCEACCASLFRSYMSFLRNSASLCQLARELLVARATERSLAHLPGGRKFTASKQTLRFGIRSTGTGGLCYTKQHTGGPGLESLSACWA